MRTIVVAFALLLSACNTADSMGSKTAPAADWRVEITSDGGFSGRGVGSVAIAPDRVEGTTMSGTCEGKLTGEERDTLQRFVDAAEPDAWRDVPPPSRGADMIRYTLTLRRAGEEKSISWTGEDVSALPRDAASLFETAWRVRSRICA